MAKLISFTFLALFVANISFGQYHREFGSVDECYGKTFSVVAWVLTDTMNTTDPLTRGQVEAAIASTNNLFSDICVDFTLCDYVELPNHRQDTLVRGIRDEEIAALYRKKNVINLYFSTFIIDPTVEAGPCGYAPLGDTVIPPDTNTRDAIFLQKDCFGWQVLAHELGHYFGLYHTFETDAFGVELADGSNCETAGDLLCDTQADPDGSNDGDCHLFPQTRQPETGLVYEPPVCNIMSYYSPDCTVEFTRGQYNRMLSIMKTGRSYLW